MIQKNLALVFVLFLSFFSQTIFASTDSYTYDLKLPDKRHDARDFLSGPENWVRTVAPVEATIPGTKPVTEMHMRRITSDGKTEEHWESCNDACGPGCGSKNKMMGGCEVLNGPQDPISYSWKKADGRNVTCEYEAWSCKAHPKCRTHDRCLIDCKTRKHLNVKACKLLCHASAVGICSTVGGWIWGDPIPGCWTNKIVYTRVIKGSCRE